MKMKFLLLVLGIFTFSNLFAQCPGTTATDYLNKAKNTNSLNTEAVNAYTHLANYYRYKCECENGNTEPEKLVKFINNMVTSYSSMVSKYGTMTNVSSCKGLGDGNSTSSSNSLSTQNDYTKLNSTYNTAESLTNAAFGADSDASKFVQNLNRANQMYGAIDDGDYTSAIGNATQLLSGLFSRRNTSNDNSTKKDKQFQYTNKALKAFNDKKYNMSAEYFKKASDLAKGDDKNILIYFEASSLYEEGSLNKANDRIIYLLDNSPKLSINIYRIGDKIAKRKLKTSDTKKEIYPLIERIYKQRLQYFPNENPAKVHNDYVKFLKKDKLASNNEIFTVLDELYLMDPMKMSASNAYIYFKEIMNRYKVTDKQKVYDTYANLKKMLEERIQRDTKRLKILKELQFNKEELNRMDKLNIKRYPLSLKIDNQVKSGLDVIIKELN